MPQIQIDEKVFKAAQQRASDGGYSSVDAYITDVLVNDLSDEIGETPNLDHMFTPQLVADLQKISERARAGGAVYTSEQVREHFRAKSNSWEQNRAE